MSTSGCSEMADADLRAGADDQVEHAGGQADLVDGLGQQVGVERGDLGRLQHHGAAGGEGRGDLADDQVQRVVPRRDGADDADRLLDDQAVADLAPELVALDEVGEGLPVATRRGRPGPSRRTLGRAHLGRDRRRRCRRTCRPGRRRCRAGTWPARRRAWSTTTRTRPGRRRPRRRRRPRCPRARPMTSSVAESMTSIVSLPARGDPLPVDVERCRSCFIRFPLGRFGVRLIAVTA